MSRTAINPSMVMHQFHSEEESYDELFSNTCVDPHCEEVLRLIEPAKRVLVHDNKKLRADSDLFLTHDKGSLTSLRVIVSQLNTLNLLTEHDRPQYLMCLYSLIFYSLPPYYIVFHLKKVVGQYSELPVDKKKLSSLDKLFLELLLLLQEKSVDNDLLAAFRYTQAGQLDKICLRLESLIGSDPKYRDAITYLKECSHALHVKEGEKKKEGQESQESQESYHSRKIFVVYQSFVDTIKVFFSRLFSVLGAQSKEPDLTAVSGSEDCSEAEPLLPEGGAVDVSKVCPEVECLSPEGDALAARLSLDNAPTKDISRPRLFAVKECVVKPHCGDFFSFSLSLLSSGQLQLVYRSLLVGMALQSSKVFSGCLTPEARESIEARYGLVY